MKQPVLFGKPEADYFVGLIQEAARAGDEEAAKSWIDEKLRLQAQLRTALLQQAGIDDPAAGFDGALFGAL